MAVAIDATSSGWVEAATSVTTSHIVTGSDTFLWTSIWLFNGTIASETCVYNGTSMTQRKLLASDASGEIQSWVLANPDTGTHDCVFTNANSAQIFMTNASYTGVDQTTPNPDTTVSQTSTNTTFSQSITTSVDNSWLVSSGRSPGKVPTASTGTLVRKLNSTSGDAAWILDSDGARTPAGSESLDYTYSVSSTSYWIVDSIAPAAAATINSNFLAFM